MKHYGDITKLSGYDLPVVDVITGGSPCQDLSVAGKRAGLAGERSGLFMEQMRIVKEMRERDRNSGRAAWSVRPRYMVWENVPGAFSSGSPKGADFAAVIEEIIKVAEPGASVSVCVPNGGWTKSGCYYAADGSWSIAWRVHDAQFWGVPQRRKRIALVADFGGLSSPEILFERKGLSGDFAESGTAGERTAKRTGSSPESTVFGIDQQGGKGGANFTVNVGPTLAGDSHGTPHAVSFQERAGKPGGGKGILIQHEHVGALSTLNNQSVLQSAEPIPIHDQATRFKGKRGERDDGKGNGLGIGNAGDPANTLSSADRHAVLAFKQGQGTKAGGIGAQEECAPTLSAVASGTNQVPAIFDARGNGDGETAQCVGNIFGSEVIPSLVASAFKGPGNTQDGYCIAVGNGQLNQMSMAEQANTLDTMHDQQAVMVSAVDCRNGTENSEVNGTLQAKEQGQNLNSNNVCRTGSIVRRLTPLECERLQGFPDGWTDIGEWVDGKGKKHKDTDSPRYKALGNSIALPFWAWLARRICAQYERPVTMGSLFDGIGGFPLVFERCGAKAVWASEIEEFPIAVTKKHFPEVED